jgi:hypothetical protein
MRSIVFALVAFFLIPCSAAPASTKQELHAVVQNFYSWVLANGHAVQKLQPKIMQASGSVRLAIDMSTLPAYSARMMRSGSFSADFPQAVQRYYAAEQAKLDAISQEEFEQIARDGRGPMMDAEDMDVFFCAQEYEYKKSFVRKLRIALSQINGSEATATVVSPLGWQTQFKFTKASGRWLIAGYCVYQ